MHPQQASVLTCVVLAETSEGLTCPRVLEGAHYKCWAPSDLTGSILLEIFHSVEGGDIEQVCSNLEILFPVFAIAHLFLSHLSFISCMLILFISLYT